MIDAFCKTPGACDAEGCAGACKTLRSNALAERPSVRDMFAMHAATVILSDMYIRTEDDTSIGGTFHTVAVDAYEFADAMMLARVRH